MEQTQILVAVIACAGTLGSALIGAVMTPYIAAYVAKRTGKGIKPQVPQEVVQIIEREVPVNSSASYSKFALYVAVFAVMTAMMLCMCGIIAEISMPTPGVCYFDPVFGFVCQ